MRLSVALFAVALCGMTSYATVAAEPVAAEPTPARGKLLSFEIVIADGQAADIAATKETSAEQILTLEKEGKLARVMRMKLSTLEQQPTTLQFGEQVPVVSGRAPMRGRGDEFAETFTYSNAGTNVTLTATVEDDGSIVAELSLERSTIVNPKPTAESDSQKPRPFTPSKTTIMQVKNAVRISPGKTRIVSGQQSSDGQEASQTWVLISAQVIGASEKVVE